MILYLRNKKNQTIVDVEIFRKNENNKEFIELHSSVIIDTYSELFSQFLEKNEKNINVFISDFSNISELRKWLWETYFMGTQNDSKKLQNVISEVSNYLKEIGNKYDLNFVID